MSLVDDNEKIMRQLGEAFVTWSEIENLWRSIFPRVLFRGFVHPVADRFDEAGLPRPWPQGERCHAMWDSITNSKTQLDLILAVSDISLTQPEEQKGLAVLKRVASETHNLRGLRNALAHSGIERVSHVEPSGQSGFITIGPQKLELVEHAHKRIRGKDLQEELPRVIEEFRIHREKVRAIYTWLFIGYPENAGDQE